MASVRCLNCLNRIEVEPKAVEVKCLHCRVRYRLSWPTPEQAKIREIVGETPGQQ